MAFLICPRWRRERPVSPSDIARSYRSIQHVQVQARTQDPGNCSKPAELPNQKHSESFSHILRRRFSRESKPFSEPREPGKFPFPFSLKSSRSFPAKSSTELTPIEDYGSSLMSERGYDSDAHCISTPKRSGHLGRSPASPGLRRLELSDLVEQSQERSEAEQWAVDNRRDISAESTFGMHFIPTPPQSLRALQVENHATHNTVGSNLQVSVSEEGRRDQDQPTISMDFIRSLPSLPSINFDLGSSTTVPLSTANTRESPDDQNTMADWKRFLKVSRQRYGFASSESLPNPSTEIVVHRTRQVVRGSQPSRSFTDPNSIHLNELGISNKLASRSPSEGNGSCNSSLVGFLRRKQFRFFVNSSQEDMRTRQHSVMPGDLEPDLQNRATRRDASSCYSRQESVPSVNTSFNAAKKVHISKLECAQRSGIATISVENVPAPDTRVLSRFREHCDSGRSKPLQLSTQSNGVNSLSSARKVSVGWMSEGRRVGYGYSLVPDFEEDQQSRQEGSLVNVARSSEQKAEIIVSNQNMNNNRHVPQEHSGYESAARSTGRGQNFEPVTTPSHYPESEAVKLPQTHNITHPLNGHVAPLYLRPIEGNRSNPDQACIPPSNQIGEEISMLQTPELASTTQPESDNCEARQDPHYTKSGGGHVTCRWDRLSREMKPLPRVQNGKEDGQKTWVIGAPYPIVMPEVAITDRNEAVPESPELLDTEDFENEAQVPELQFNGSRAARWALRFSRNKESRRLSTVHKQEQSQSSSDTYQDCDSSSIKRATSTKSNMTEDPECSKMPGSFEGSRWASRISRMF